MERLLGKAVSLSADQIKRIGRATVADAGQLGFIKARWFRQSFQFAGDAAIAAGREAALLEIGTRGAEAVVRASVREAELSGADLRPVVDAWDAYRTAKGGELAARDAASDDLDRALRELIGKGATRWIVPAGVGVQRAALAVALWDIADPNSRFKPKHRTRLTWEWRTLKLKPDFLPEPS